MTAPRSSLALAADKLARMVALSETFDGGRGYQAAAARVYRKNAVGTELRPLAVISPGEKHDLELVSGGAQNFLRPSGSLFLYLARDTPLEFHNDCVRAEDDAANWFGEVIEQVADLSARDDPESSDGTSHLAIVRISRVIFDEVDDQHWDALGRFYFAGYSVDWGDS